MLQAYAPILILLALAAGFAVVGILVSELLGRRRRNVGKGDAYECGMEASGSARVRLSIHFYLVSVLFILFDVEAIFLVLWAVTARDFQAAGYGHLVLAEVLSFVGILGLALAWVWRKGGLEWDR
ncbi:MAG TPA: NADH-quinone oxidoreductase subunit A [Planctomycetota bacterium]|jgi:NADH-quinone oxidoreductase subunit A|nr:NADH-quinone oxidoreductase subunit A [Planctomycetota bacterium]